MFKDKLSYLKENKLEVEIRLENYFFLFQNLVSTNQDLCKACRHSD